jgi:CotH kinase protein
MTRPRSLVVALTLLIPAACASPAAARALPEVSLAVPGAIPNEPKLAGRMTIRDGKRVDYRGRIGIERRGQTSQVLFPKKSWSVETRTARGGNRSVSLLGMPKENDWVLYAAYNDKTLMRNVLAYETARGMGRYASRTRFVELTLNGSYEGVYVLMERPKLDGDRVDVDKPGTLLEWTFDWQARTKGKAFRLPRTRRTILFEDPERGDLSPARRAAVRASLAAAERALYGRSFRHPQRGWRAHIDEAAAVDFVLLNELFKNQDAFRASTYLARGGDGRWRLGPIWDFDISMGNSDFGESRVVAGSMLARRQWASRFYRDPRFQRALAARWRELRRDGLAGKLQRSVRGHAGRLAASGAAGRNFRRWPVLGRRIWPNPAQALSRTTYGSEVGALRSWLSRRVSWLDRHVGRLRR